MNKLSKISLFSKVLLFSLICFITLYSCTKDDTAGTDDVNNSLTLFKLDNKNNDVDLTSADTVSSMSGVNGKYIPVSGATGAARGLDSIKIELFTTNDSLINSITISSFFKPGYHTINSQLVIPASQKGKVYKVVVKVIDKTGATVGTKGFYGVDVVTCDPLPPCLVANQITVMLETPAGTPETDAIYLFGSLNGWSRGDAAFVFHKNPDVANCYCLTLPYAPGYSGWQVGEVYVTRGEWGNDAVTSGNETFIVNYTTTEMGPLWKIKVQKWRDQ